MSDTHRFVPFRMQRSLAAFLVAGLLGLYTISVQWSHVDQIPGLLPAYAPLIKTGLASVELIIIILLVWELWARNKALTLACFVSVVILEVVCVIHAGAILQLDTNHATERQQVQDSFDAQIRMAAEVEKAKIAATAEAAAKLNQLGQKRTARQVAGNIGAASAPSLTVPSAKETSTRKSFLPDWYLNGGQYFAVIMLAYFLFASCFFVSRGYLEDEPVATSGAVKPTSSVPMAATLTSNHAAKPTVGFATGGNFQPATVAKVEADHPKESPRK